MQDIGQEIYQMSFELQKTVSKWYYRVLMVAIVGMMSVLVYIGIRILLSSVASDKAKYKQMMGDWLIGMVILFVMHYGMIFANELNDNLVSFLGSINDSVYLPVIEDETENGDGTGTIAQKLNDAGFTKVDSNTESLGYTNYAVDGNKIMLTTNLMGKLRFDLQYNKSNSTNYIGYTIMFLVMVIYLVVFGITYVKRVIYMAFLTMIAPLVALTYPIDKVNDGKAQGFNFWFKEYAFNLLLQPMHLLLYTILVSSAIELATKNMIYAIIALGFMVPAEKILRQMFNFGKASTPGVFGGAAGAAMVMSGMKWIAGHGPKDKGSQGGGVSSGKSSGNTQTSKVGNAGVHTSSGVMNEVGSSTASATTNSNLRNVGVNKYGNGKSATHSMKNTHGSVKVGNKNMGSVAARRRINTNSSKGRLERAGERLRVGAASIANQKKQNFIRKVKDGSYIKAGAKTLSSFALGSAGAVMGGSAAVASGDAGNVIKYGAAGAMALGAVGAGVIDKSSRNPYFEGLNEEVERNIYGNAEYERREAMRKQEEMIRNEATIRAIEKELNIGRFEAQERAEEIIPFYADNKIDDLDTMLKLEKVAQKAYVTEYSGNAVSREKARNMTYQGFHQADVYGITNGTKDKDREDKFNIMKEENNFNDKEQEAAKKLVRNYLKYSK